MQLKAYWELVRPPNVLLTFASVFVGASVAGAVHPLEKVLLACISASLVAAGGYALNDLYDQEIDRINRPRRPLPSGRLSPGEVLLFSLILLASGVLIGSFIHPWALRVALFCAFLLFFYNARLKRTPLWGNLAISLLTGLAFVYGGLAVGRPWLAFIPAGFAFLFHLGRELIKDTQDFWGDVAGNARTVPICWGTRWALGITTGVFLGLIALTPLPFLWGIYGWPYLVVVIGVDLVLAYVLLSMWSDPQPGNLGRLSTVLKVDMLLGLLALFLGR